MSDVGCDAGEDDEGALSSADLGRAALRCGSSAVSLSVSAVLTDHSPPHTV